MHSHWKRVDGKVVVVTGAGGGIGEGIAKRMAEEGAKVVVSDVREDGGTRVVEEIKNAGGHALFIPADVTQSSEVKNLVEQTLKHFGDLSVMVNNAGWTHKNRSALEVSEEEFDKCFSVNVKSIYLTTVHTTPIFKKEGEAYS